MASEAARPRPLVNNDQRELGHPPIEKAATIWAARTHNTGVIKSE